MPVDLVYLLFTYEELSDGIFEMPAANQRTPEQKRKDFFRHVWATYRITEAEYWRLYEVQGGRCYICKKAKGIGPDNKGRRYLAVDHNHFTGAVRGLLCSGSLSANTCNRLIALYDVQALERAVEYLRKPPAFKLREASRDERMTVCSEIDPKTDEYICGRCPNGRLSREFHPFGQVGHVDPMDKS